MKNGFNFLMAVAVLCVLGLTQGCVTSESHGSGLGPTAKHKGFYREDHKGAYRKVGNADMLLTDYDNTGFDGATIEETPVLEEVEIETTMETIPPIETTRSHDLYIVQPGDILSKLAVRYDTTTATLVEMNNLSNPDVLYVGQELKVPAGRVRSSSAASSLTTTPVRSESVKKGGTYTIQKGDTLSEIASRAKVSIDDLRALNSIQGDMIMAGETLVIPAGGVVPPVRNTASSVPPSTDSAAESNDIVEPLPVDGQVPAGAEVSAPVSDNVGEAVSPSPADNVVVVDVTLYPGQTLDTLASDFEVSKAVIMRYNNITDESLVKSGDTISIPLAQ